MVRWEMLTKDSVREEQLLRLPDTVRNTDEEVTVLRASMEF